MTNQEPLWTEDHVADYLAISVETLRRWRRKHTGPPAFQLVGDAGPGRSVIRYDPQAVRAWLNERAEVSA
jgi:hypothetical protein